MKTDESELRRLTFARGSHGIPLQAVLDPGKEAEKQTAGRISRVATGKDAHG